MYVWMMGGGGDMGITNQVLIAACTGADVVQVCMYG